MDQDLAPKSSPAGTLVTLRVLWAAMLAGQFILLAVVGVMIARGPQPPTQPDGGAGAGMMLFGIACVMLVTLVPLGHVIRNQFYKKHWRENVIAPEGYFSGNLLLLALCEGISFLGLVTCLMERSFWPYIIPSVLALAVQVINFPNGRAMQPHDPAFADVHQRKAGNAK